MRRVWWLVCCAALVGAGPVAGSARASGPVEQVVQVLFHPRDPDVIVLRYEYKGEGLFYSDDAGQSWRLMCGSFASSQLPGEVAPADREFDLITAAIAGDGTVLGAAFDLLWEGEPGGCEWSTRPEYDGVWITDFAAHPSDPDVLFFSTGESAQPNGVMQRMADGSFAELASPEDVQILRLRAAETASGLRIYQGAISGMVEVTVDEMTFEAPRYVIRVSDDGGSFEEFDVGWGNEALQLVAVDPSDPDRIVAQLDRVGAPDDLMVSADRGANFERYHSLTRLGGIAFAPDGRVLIAEEPDDGVSDPSLGLWFADSLDEAPTKISDVEAFCAGYQAATDTFFACPQKQFGRVDTTDGTFTPLFDFRTVSDFVACEGRDVASACQGQLCVAYCGLGHFAQAPVCAQYEGPFCGPCAAPDPPDRCAVSDAGLAAGAGGGAGTGTGTGADAGTVAVESAGGGCSCRTAGSPRAPAAPAAWFALGSPLFWLAVRARLRSGAGRARPSPRRTAR
jgi:hypothetical protein